MKKQKEMRSERDPLSDLKFYSGDITDEDPDDPVFSDPKAYVTLNALLFDGIETEQARAAEGRKLNPAFITRFDTTIALMQGILSNMHPLQEDTVVFRVERFSDFNQFERCGMMTSFISCSDAGFLSSYTDKADLVFMEVHVHPGVLCVRLEEVLDFYLKKEEHELLIGPYCPIRITSLPVPQKYAHIKDRNGNPVSVYTVVDVYPSKLKKGCAMEADACQIASSIRVVEAVNAGAAIDKNDLSAYLSFKKKIQETIRAK